MSNHERVPIDYNKLQVQLEQVLGVRIESIDDMRIKYQHLRPELQEKIRTIGGMGGNSVSSGCGFTAGLIIGLKS